MMQMDAISFVSGLFVGHNMAMNRPTSDDVPRKARSGIVLGAGIAIGYGLAMKNQEPNGEIKKATAEFIRTGKNLAADFFLDMKIAGRDSKETNEDIEGR